MSSANKASTSSKNWADSEDDEDVYPSPILQSDVHKAAGELSELSLNAETPSTSSEKKQSYNSAENMRPKEWPTKPPWRVQCNNLKYELTEGELHTLLAPKCNITNIYKIYSKNQPRGQAVVEFDDLESLKNAFDFWGVELLGRPVRFNILPERSNDKAPQPNKGGQNGGGSAAGQGNQHGPEKKQLVQGQQVQQGTNKAKNNAGLKNSNSNQNQNSNNGGNRPDSRGGQDFFGKKNFSGTGDGVFSNNRRNNNHNNHSNKRVGASSEEKPRSAAPAVDVLGSNAAGPKRERPKLQIIPLSQLLEAKANSPTSADSSSKARPDPFAGARPREEVLKEKLHIAPNNGSHNGAHGDEESKDSSDKKMHPGQTSPFSRGNVPPRRGKSAFAAGRGRGGGDYNKGEREHFSDNSKKEEKTVPAPTTNLFDMLNVGDE